MLFFIMSLQTFWNVYFISHIIMALQTLWNVYFMLLDPPYIASDSKMATVRHIEHTSLLNMLLWISLSLE